MKKTEESVQSNDTGSASDPVKEERRRVKRSYGVSTTAVLFQILVINLVSVGANVVLQAIAASRLQAENPGVSAEELKVLVSEDVAQQAVLTTLISLAAAGLALVVATFVGYKMLHTFGFRDSLHAKTRAKAVPLGVIGILAVQPVSVLISLLLRTIAGTNGSSADLANTMSGNGDPVGQIIAMIYSCIFAALLEELFFRGFMLNALSPVSKWFAIIVSSLMFALIHGNLGQFPNTFIIGIIHGYIALKAGSIIPNIVAHMLTNFMAFAAGFAAEAWGDTGYVVFFIAEFVIAAPCLILFFKKNGRINNKTDIIAPGLNSELPAKSENTVKLLLGCPSFWIAVIFELGSMITVFMSSMAATA